MNVVCRLGVQALPHEEAAPPAEVDCKAEGRCGGRIALWRGAIRH